MGPIIRVILCTNAINTGLDSLKLDCSFFFIFPVKYSIQNNDIGCRTHTFYMINLCEQMSICLFSFAMLVYAVNSALKQQEGAKIHYSVTLN